MTSFFSLQFEESEQSGGDRCSPEEIGTYPGGAGVASLVEAIELEDPVWAALAAVRSLGELSVFLGGSPGLGACLLFVISAGVFARVALEEGLGAVRAGFLGVSRSLW